MKCFKPLVISIFFIVCGLSVSLVFAQEKKILTSPRCNQFTFDASSSYDPDNENISFFWDFGDGQTSTTPIVDHAYDKSGLYNVTLSVTDNSTLQCATSTITQTVRANIPPEATFSSPELACSNKPIEFNAQSSELNAADKLSYSWDFGDGTKTNGQPSVSKMFSKGGRYKISLAVDDNNQTACSKKVFEKDIVINDPPIANAGAAELFKCISQETDYLVTFNASNSSDINTDALTYFWDFGDGKTAEGIEVSHKYPETGTYDVKLIVKDSTDIGCGTAVDFVSVKLSNAPKANAGDDILICSGESVAFDGSQSTVYKIGTTSAKWSFGDGESAETLKIEHKYLKPGAYQATLNIIDELNKMCPESRDTRLVTVNAIPTVSLKAEESACVGVPVQLEAAADDADGDKLEYYWSFGDGEISKGVAKTNHKYTQGGVYRSTVIVDDGKNSNCSTATAEVQIRINTPPVADAGPNLACCVGGETEFNASASSDPDSDNLTYTWDFGDGVKGYGAIAKHTYNKSGSYNVNVTVDDNSGSACSRSIAGFVAEVNAKPVPIMNIR